MEKLEQLSNNQLREELKKLGLGNFPVTDTTRKLLIKKLFNALEGKSAPAKTRRETVHVPKIVDDSESDRETNNTTKTKTISNRRATIAAQPAVKEVKQKPVAEPVKPGRTTPLLSTNNTVITKTIEITAENSDDDQFTKNIHPVRNRRTSRSPSLGKSTVVTTSYKHLIEPLNELEADELDDEDLIMLNNDNNRKSDNAKGFTTSEKLNDYSSKFNWSKPSVDRRTTYEANINYNTILPKEDNVYHDKTQEITKRRYTTSAAGGKPDKRNDDDDDILENINTPFLSSFTRRLAELKAEPLPLINPTVDRDPLPTSNYRTQTPYYRDYTTTSHLSQRYQYNKPDTVWESFKNFLKAFERKIRWPFLILLALLAIIFIYVFLFTN